MVRVTEEKNSDFTPDCHVLLREVSLTVILSLNRKIPIVTANRRNADENLVEEGMCTSNDTEIDAPSFFDLCCSVLNFC